MARVRFPQCRFSLRTMLVVVTLLCLALAWLFPEWRKIRERNLVADWANERSTLAGILQPHSGVHYFHEEIPWHRRLIGDRGHVSFIYVPGICTEAEREWARLAFPEAKLFIAVPD